jgi:hypothetical protein
MFGQTSLWGQSTNAKFKTEIEENGFLFFGIDSGTVDYKIYIKKTPLQAPFNKKEEIGKSFQLQFYDEGRKRVYTGGFLNDSGISKIEADKSGYLIHHMDGSVDWKNKFHFFPDELIKSKLIYFGKSGSGRYCRCISKKKDKQLHLGKKNCVFFPSFGLQSEVHHNKLDSLHTYVGVAISYYKNIPLYVEAEYSSGYFVVISANNIKQL